MLNAVTSYLKIVPGTMFVHISAALRLGQVGEANQVSNAGVDYAGAGFLISDAFTESGIVFGFRACYRYHNSPIRFQIWRPVQDNSNSSSLTLKLLFDFSHKTTLSQNILLPSIENKVSYAA